VPDVRARAVLRPSDLDELDAPGADPDGWVEMIIARTLQAMRVEDEEAEVLTGELRDLAWCWHEPTAEFRMERLQPDPETCVVRMDGEVAAWVTTEPDPRIDVRPAALWPMTAASVLDLGPRNRTPPTDVLFLRAGTPVDCTEGASGTRPPWLDGEWRRWRVTRTLPESDAPETDTEPGEPSVIEVFDVRRVGYWRVFQIGEDELMLVPTTAHLLWRDLVALLPLERPQL
jgi:hypothetical protein